MGCDLHSKVEVKKNGKWSIVKKKVFQADDGLSDGPFQLRCYRTFGFLANVRNLSNSPYIDVPRGFPNDSPHLAEYQEESDFGHSYSWLLLTDLLEYDYEGVYFRDMRSAAQPNELISVADFLKQTTFFSELCLLAAFGEPDKVRVVFWFDN